MVPTKMFPCKVAVLFGGVYPEHDASIFSFRNFYADIKVNGPIEDIKLSRIGYIDRNGKVLVTETDLKKPPEYYFANDRRATHTLTEAFATIRDNNEFVYLICDGTTGVDGRFTSYAQEFGVSGTFGSSLGFALTRSKFHAGCFVSSRYPGILVPKTSSLTTTEEVDYLFPEFENRKIVVKPNSLGSSIHTRQFHLTNQQLPEIKELIRTILDYDSRVLVQECIDGYEYSCYCLEKDGGVEVLKTKCFGKEGAVLTTEEKYGASGGMHEMYIEPEIPALNNFSIQLFKDTDCTNLARTDFIVTADEEFYFLENNCNPALRGFIAAYRKKYQACCVFDMLKIFIVNEHNRKKFNSELHLDLH